MQGRKAAPEEPPKVVRHPYRQVLGLGVFRVSGLRFRDQDLGLRNQGLGFRDQGLGVGLGIRTA